MITEEMVKEVCKTCYDPEIPVNIYDLGLIYGIEVKEEAVKVTMSLTSRGCPSAQQLPDEVRRKILDHLQPREATVEVVWDPPWTPEKLSPDARKILGIE